MEILNEEAMNMYQVKEELAKIKKRDNELNFRANKTEEYLNQFTHIKDTDKLYEKISKLKIPRLKDQHIHKIIDIMPKTEDDLKAVLQGYTVTVNKDATKKVVSAVNDFLKEAK